MTHFAAHEPDVMARRAVTVRIRGLRKAYGTTQALAGIDADAYPGEVLGVIGPNGAGKTTLLETLIGLRRPDEGKISVLGLDPWRQRAALLRQVALQPQQSALFHNLTVRETVTLWVSFYPDASTPGTLIELVSLGAIADTRVKTLSGGQRQRLRLALALAASTPLVLLDEPTSALDPQARERVWDVIRSQGAQGSVVMSTHSMDEAETICDRVLVIDAGRVIAQGTPSELVTAHAGDGSVLFRTRERLSHREVAELAGVTFADVRSTGACSSVRLATSNRGMTLTAISARPGWAVAELRERPPALQDVFLTLTGRNLREED